MPAGLQDERRTACGSLPVPRRHNLVHSRTCRQAWQGSLASLEDGMEFPPVLALSAP